MSSSKEKYIDSGGQELTKTTWNDGTQVWFKDGRWHRLDGPAYIGSNGFQSWYKDDLRHREGGPAVINSNGYKAWYKDGKQHREDGPAVVHPDGTVEYWLNGKQVSKREVDLYWIKKQIQS